MQYISFFIIRTLQSHFSILFNLLSALFIGFSQESITIIFGTSRGRSQLLSLSGSFALWANRRSLIMIYCISVYA